MCKKVEDIKQTQNHIISPSFYFIEWVQHLNQKPERSDEIRRAEHKPAKKSSALSANTGSYFGLHHPLHRSVVNTHRHSKKTKGQYITIF